MPQKKKQSKKISKCPKSIDFGTLKAKVIMRPPSGTPGSEVAHIVIRSGEIFLEDGLHPDFEREVVLHECLHGVISYNEVLSEDLKRFEEDIVKSLSPALLNLLQANPKLVAYLTKQND